MHKHELAYHIALAEQLVPLSGPGQRQALRDERLDPLLFQKVKEGDQIH